MRGPMSYDDVEALESGARTPDQHRAAASTLIAWADEPHPDDVSLSTAQLLTAAAWHLGRAGDVDRSLDLYRRAVADGGACIIDARVQLAGALMEAGEEAEARSVAADFRRDFARLADLAMMAEVFEDAGDLRQAHRLVNIGLNRLQLDADGAASADAFDLHELVRTRRRIRAALGYPRDDFDESEL